MQINFLLALGIVGLLLVGYGVTKSVNGARTIEQITAEERNIDAFRAISVSGIGEVVITQGETQHVRVETDADMQRTVTSEVRDGTLYLGLKTGAVFMNTPQIRVTVTATALEQVKVSGAANVSMNNIRSARLAIENAGTGTVTVAGVVREQHVTLSGAGRYDGENLVSDRAAITISGVGTAVVQVQERLDATLNGGGSVEYIGHPDVHEKISGVGSIRQRQAP